MVLRAHQDPQTKKWVLQYLQTSHHWSCVVSSDETTFRLSGAAAEFESREQLVSWAESRGFTLEAPVGMQPVSKLAGLYPGRNLQKPLMVSLDGGATWVDSKSVLIRTPDKDDKDASICLTISEGGIISDVWEDSGRLLGTASRVWGDVGAILQRTIQTEKDAMEAA